MAIDKSYKDGQPCGHCGCLHHRSHPCEGCGRIGGRNATLSELHLEASAPEEWELEWEQTLRDYRAQSYIDNEMTDEEFDKHFKEVLV
jgi:hypothetical protein